MNERHDFPGASRQDRYQSDPHAELPPLRAGCELTVVIPARDEERTILSCLRALADQRDAAAFDVIVLANNCTDGTAQLVRRFARDNSLSLHVVETILPAAVAHVGTARRMAMDCAAERFFAAGRPTGIVASTDADTVVAPDWVERTVEEMRSVDAVAGYVELSRFDEAAMVAPVRALFAQEAAFREAWTDLESLIDPRPEDPAPRHGAFVGANFAVTAAIYRRAGGLPPLATLEDREFLFSLRRVDARIRYSLRMRAWTSGRRFARVEGGFNTFVRHLHDQGRRKQTYLVVNPAQIIDELDGRAALRRMWSGIGIPSDRPLIEALFGRSLASIDAAIDRSMPFGENYDRIMQDTFAGRKLYAMVPVGDAIVALRAALASRNACAPTRSSTASGAG